MKKTHWILLNLIIVLSSCGNTHKQNNSDLIKIIGKTQGTTYHISYMDDSLRNYKVSIDSILEVIDLSMSTYIPNSIITKFNKTDSIIKIDHHFLNVYWKSLEVYYRTNGCFNPTVKPLIEFWGFSSNNIKSFESVIDTAIVDSILNFVTIEKLHLIDNSNNKIVEYMESGSVKKGDYSLIKDDNRIQLDFNAIAQGYSVDVIVNFLEIKGIKNYLVEVGGELRVKGHNNKNTNWKVGIDKPKDNSEMGRELEAVLSLNNQSVATSGNYRKFFIKEGIKYSHTIDAITGFPVRNKILSATIIAEDCMTSDAYATACMVMGYTKSRAFLEQNPELQGYLIYSKDNGEYGTYFTIGMGDLIEETPH